MADLKAEQTFVQLRIAYTEVEIGLSEIDWRESQHNGARLHDAIVPKLVEDYTMAMMSGDAFPRIVIRAGSSGYVILSGNQRSEAVRRLVEAGKLPKTTKIAAYMMQTSDTLLWEIFARSGNVGHGGRSEVQERILHAVYSVQSLGLTAANAAKVFNVNAGTITDAIRVAKERRELAESGVAASLIPASVMVELARVHDHGSKIKLGHLVASHAVTAAALKPVRVAVNKARNQSARLASVKQLESQLAEEAHRANCNGKKQPVELKVPKRPWRDRIIRDLTAMGNFLESGRSGESFTSLQELQIACDADEASVRNQWERVKLHMTVILKARK